MRWGAVWSESRLGAGILTAASTKGSSRGGSGTVRGHSKHRVAEGTLLHTIAAVPHPTLLCCAVVWA